MPGLYTIGQSHCSFKKKSFIGIQIAELTDISKKSLLLAYVTYFFNGKVSVDFLKCFSLKEKNAVHIYDILSMYLKWSSCDAVLCSKKNGMAGLFE